MGRLSENFMGLQDNAPAVILNPDAHPLAVLAWCWGGLRAWPKLLAFMPALQPGEMELLTQATPSTPYSRTGYSTCRALWAWRSMR